VIDYDSDDYFIGTVVTVDDITEQKALQRSRDEFFSIASHELRTPLTAIRGNTSMIQDYFPKALADPDLKSMIDDIHESSVRLITLVNDFLDTSRLELGKIKFDIKPVNVPELKFTEAGSVTIAVRQNGTQCEMRVTDTGKGIPLDSQSLLFRKFQQASNNILTRDSTRSSGLGLYISKLIINGMNGAIELESSVENQGSTFLVSLPVAEPARVGGAS
jgi:signal transduction histidine kinase